MQTCGPGLPGFVLQTAADRLALGHDAQSLRPLVADAREFVRLVDALVRVRHDKDGYRELQELAGQETRHRPGHEARTRPPRVMDAADNAPGRRWGVHEFVRQVAEATGADEEPARGRAETVLTVLADHLRGAS